MPIARLLTAERNRGVTVAPSFEEVPTGRSVRSICQKFEAAAPQVSASAPSTPAKKRSPRHRPRAQTKTQLELAAFLKGKKPNILNTSATPSQGVTTVSNGTSALPSLPSQVGSLIEKWTAASTPRPSLDRPPLQERHLQRADHDIPSAHRPHHRAKDSLDTFGSSSVDLERIVPNNDPAALQSCPTQTSYIAPLAEAATSTSEQRLNDAIAHNGLLQQEQGSTLTSQLIQKAHHQFQGMPGVDQNQETQAQFVHVNREWRIEENFEFSVQHSEINGQNFALSGKNSRPCLLKNPALPSCPAIISESVPSGMNSGPLPPSHDSSDVTSSGETTIIVNKVTAQTEYDAPVDLSTDWAAGDVYIRELFSEAEETAERAVQCDENEDYFSAFELYWTVVDLYSKVIPFLSPAEGVDVHERIKMYTRRCEAIREAFEEDAEDDIPGSENAIIIPPNQRDTQESVQRIGKSNLEQTFANALSLNPAELSSQSAHQRSPAHPVVPTEVSPPQTFRESTLGASSHSGEGETHDEYGITVKVDDVCADPSFTDKAELKRTPYPDYSERPLASIPDAGDPRRTFITGAALSASTQAHRNSLSRPISRSAARKSTNSITRQKVAEMQERVNLMQECLNNFTVKQKHLGPARALELAVTTLNANTFGDLKKLEPLAPELEHKWSTELEVLLSMLKEIKEVQPGRGYALREDIAKHLPALERCDRSVRHTMRSFAALYGHVRYVDRETVAGYSHGGRAQRRWWVKVPVVDSKGLHEDVLKVVQEAEIEMRGVFKICHEINVEIVKEIPIPRSFVDSLPRHARSLIPRDLKEGLTTWGMFKVSDYMKDKNIWNKDAAKDIVSSLEKVSLIWEARTTPNKSFFSRTFDIRGERFHQAITAFRRCQTAIRDLRRDW